MLRRSRALPFQAHYGATMRSHADMLAKYGSTSFKANTNANGELVRKTNGEEFARAAIPLLERVESRVAMWKRAKWEFRTPALLSADEKTAAVGLLRKLQSECERFSAKRRQLNDDTALVAKILKVGDHRELRLKSRAWLQERVAALRMDGRVDDARQLREAWLRMEALGGPDYDLLERLVLVYGLGKMGTFDRAFGNTIVPVPRARRDPAVLSKPGTHDMIRLDNTNPLADLLRLTLANVRDIHILYDFLGWNEGLALSVHAGPGYGASLGEYMARCLKYAHRDSATAATAPRHAMGSASTRLLFTDNAKKIYLLRDTAAATASYALWNGPNLTIITVADANKHLRQHQQLHKKQLEGMCRRSAFVLGVPLDDVRVRSLLLPPNALDKRSLLRLHAALDPDASISSTAINSVGGAVGANGNARSSATFAGVAAEVESNRAAANARMVAEEAAVHMPGLDARVLENIPPAFRGWLPLYRAEVPQADEDYAAIADVLPEEEWTKL